VVACRRRRQDDAEREGSDTVFLVGHPRSGTTVLARALGCHPEIGYWEEPNLLLQADGWLRQLRAMADHLQVDATAPLVETGTVGNLREVFGTDRVDPDLSNQVAVEAVRDVLVRMRRAHLAASDARILLEKSPRQLLQMGVRALVLPRATVLHIVRDPRDVVASACEWDRRWGRPGWLTVDGPLVRACAEQWVDLVQRAPDDAMTISYEALATDPHTVTGRVLGRLGLTMHQEVEEFLARGMGGANDRSVGRWRHDLDTADRRVVEEIATDAMAHFGYT